MHLFLFHMEKHFSWSFEGLSPPIFYLGSSGLPCLSQYQYCSKLVFREHERNLFVCRMPGDGCIFHLLLTGNRSSFPYSPPSVPIVLKLLTNKVKSTSPKHFMLELTCMQNTQYWMRCRKHYSVQKICYWNYGVIFRIWQIAWRMKCLDTGGLLEMHMSGNKITGCPRQCLNFDLIAENFWQESSQAAVDFLS